MPPAKHPQPCPECKHCPRPELAFHWAIYTPGHPAAETKSVPHTLKQELCLRLLMGELCARVLGGSNQRALTTASCKSCTSVLPSNGDRSPPGDCEPRDLERLMHGREITVESSRLAGKHGRHDSLFTATNSSDQTGQSLPFFPPSTRKAQQISYMYLLQI